MNVDVMYAVAVGRMRYGFPVRVVTHAFPEPIQLLRICTGCFARFTVAAPITAIAVTPTTGANGTLLGFPAPRAQALHAVSSGTAHIRRHCSLGKYNGNAIDGTSNAL